MPDARSQWRITISATQSGEPGLAALVMRTTPNGPDVCTGGTASASSEYSGTYTAAKAFDANNATAWYSSSGFPQWLQYDFGAAVDIVEYQLRAPTNYPTEAPKTWTFSHNDGAGGWTEVDAQTTVPNWSESEERTYTFDAPEHDPDLGELLAHHFHPTRRSTDDDFRDRSGPVHHLHPGRRKPALVAPVYLADFAHCPIRLNGRDCPGYYGPSAHDGWPWTLAGQPATSTEGRIFYHPMRWRLFWLVAPGLRTLSVPVACNYQNGVRPRLELRANAALGVAAAVSVENLVEIPHGFPDATYPPITAPEGAYELGTRFRPSQNTRATALRFYRPDTTALAVTGRLWNAAGTLLASAPYALSGTGWQTTPLTPHIDLTAGQDYVTSFGIAAGVPYAYQHYYFDAAHTVDLMTAPAAAGGAPNGVYNATPGAFPTDSFRNALYFSDIVFESAGTSSTLAVECRPTLAGLVTVDLVHADPTEGRTVTFGTITAT
jgi:hypothetical protein